MTNLGQERSYSHRRITNLGQERSYGEKR
jgi:hypothetical protein